MRIEEVRVRVADPARHANARIRGFISVVLAGDGLTIAIHDLRVIRGNDRWLVVWPNQETHRAPANGRQAPRYDRDGNAYYFRDVAHPVDRETRERFDRAILGAFGRAIKLRLTDYVERPADVTHQPGLRVVPA